MHEAMRARTGFKGCFLSVGLAVLAGCAGTSPATLSGDDRRTVQAVEAYLDDRPRLQADFDESGADGPAGGTLWLDRPGRLRVDYLSPVRKTLVAKDGRLTIADLSTGASTTLPVADTPLGILLPAKVALSGAVRVVAIRRRDGVLLISLDEPGSRGGGVLTLDFREAPLALIGLSVQDRAGRLNNFVLKDITEPASIDQAKFDAAPVFIPAG